MYYQMEPNKTTATRLKSSKYKTHVIKEQLLKWMSCNKMNQSHGVSYYEILFFSYQKASKLKRLIRTLKEG